MNNQQPTVEPAAPQPTATPIAVTTEAPATTGPIAAQAAIEAQGPAEA